MALLPKYARIGRDDFRPVLTVEAPGYPYITVRVNKSIKAEHVYWHLVDPTFSLLELGFERSSGRLTHISMPLFKGEIGEADYVIPDCTQGEPVFELDFALQDAKRTDVVKAEGRIALNRSGKDLDIVLARSPVSSCVCCQRILVYGFDTDQRLCLIRLRHQADTLCCLTGFAKSHV